MKIFLLLLLAMSSQLFSSFKKDLLSRIENPPPSWMIEQIESDLAIFQETGISSLDLENVAKDFSTDRQLIHIKIKNNHVTFAYPHKDPLKTIRTLSLFKTFQRLANMHLLPDLELLIHAGDYVDQDPSGPIFSFAKPKSIKKVISFPDFEALLGYSKIRKEVVKATNAFPFENKIDKVFWRGSTTGGVFSQANWKTYPRSLATLLSLENPDLLDAKFTALVQMQDETAKEDIKNANVLSENVPIFDHIKYRYLLDIDGNSCTYSRLYWILLSNCVCIKQITENEQWYYKGIKPFEHYLPVNSDLSDLFEVLAWAKENPEECEIIVERSTSFAKEDLSFAAIHQYIYLLLQAYAKLLRP